MQLISLPVSPFAARVRIAIYAKQLDIHVTAPPVGWPAARQFRDVNPTGRIPVLVLDDGRVIPESSVIVEFLEEQFADARPLLQTEAHERAKSRLLARVADLYLMPPMVALARPEISGDRRRYLIRELLEGFATLDAFLEGGTYAVADQLSLADCALAPVLFAARVTGERLDLDVIKPWPQVRRYAEHLEHDQHVARVLAEMDVGLREMRHNR